MKILFSLSAALLLSLGVVATSSSAQARDGWRGNHNGGYIRIVNVYRGGNYVYRRHHRGFNVGNVAAGVLAGVWLLDRILQPQPQQVVYAQPAPALVYARPAPRRISPKCERFIGYPNELNACERGARELRALKAQRSRNRAYEWGRSDGRSYE